MLPTAPIVSVVVVTWNGLHHLRRTLPAVQAQELVEGQSLELIVVDNASVDGTPEYLDYLQALDPRVRIIRNAHNQGFSAPNNQAFRAARGAFIAALNNDAPPEPGWLAALLDAAQADERIGSVASRMVFAHAPDIIQSAGISIDRAGIAWDRLVGCPAAESERNPVDVFGASAGAALYRRAMLDELGGFDDRFFMYLEDVDLAWRARLAGWRAVYAPDAVVRHAHSASAVEGSPFKNWHLGRNKVWSIARCYPPAGLRRYLAAVVAYDLASLPYTILTKRDLSPLRGRLAALREFRRILRERAALHRRYPHGWDNVAPWMEPLKPPAAVFGRYRELRRVLAQAPAPETSPTDAGGEANRAHGDAQAIPSAIKLVTYALPGQEEPVAVLHPSAEAVVTGLRARGYRQAVDFSERSESRGVLCLLDRPPTTATSPATARVLIAGAELAGELDGQGLVASAAPAEPLPPFAPRFFERSTPHPEVGAKTRWDGVPPPHPSLAGEGSSLPTIVTFSATPSRPSPQRGEAGRGERARPVHFDVDLSRPGSFAWITAELALALRALGTEVSLNESPLSEALGASVVAALGPLRAAAPAGSKVIGWDYVFDKAAQPRDFEYFALNFEFAGHDPAQWDAAMRHVLDTPSFKLPISDYCRRILVDAGLPPERCEVAHLGYSSAVDRVQDACFLPLERTAKLLAITNAHDVRRYGTDLVLAAFERAFEPRDDVALVIRDYGAYSAEIASEVERLRLRGYEALYFARLLNGEDVVRFYRACDALVAPFRGEGFGVKLLDAMACSLPVLAPMYGGPADYLTPQNCLPLRYTLSPVGDCLDTRLLPRGNQPLWCETDLDSLVGSMHAVVREPDRMRGIGQRARQDVAERFSWRAVAGRLLGVIDAAD